MGQDEVGEPRKFLPRFIVVVADRRARLISAGHDQTVGHGKAVIIGKQQEMKRRIRQHDADGRVARRHRGS